MPHPSLYAEGREDCKLALNFGDSLWKMLGTKVILEGPLRNLTIRVSEGSILHSK